jgi:hypothetical protein
MENLARHRVFASRQFGCAQYPEYGNERNTTVGSERRQKQREKLRLLMAESDPPHFENAARAFSR